MAPELYTTLTTFGDAVYVYEHSAGTLTQVPLDGTAAVDADDRRSHRQPDGRPGRR